MDLPDGVFAGTVLREVGTLHLSAVSLGTRETFCPDSAVRLIEAYLLDLDDLDELVAQIASDVRAVFEGQELIAYGISSSATEH